MTRTPHTGEREIESVFGILPAGAHHLPRIIRESWHRCSRWMGRSKIRELTGAYHLAKKSGNFSRLKVKWNSNFPENPFGIKL